MMQIMSIMHNGWMFNPVTDVPSSRLVLKNVHVNSYRESCINFLSEFVDT